MFESQADSLPKGIGDLGLAAVFVIFEPSQADSLPKGIGDRMPMPESPSAKGESQADSLPKGIGDGVNGGSGIECGIAQSQADSLPKGIGDP